MNQTLHYKILTIAIVSAFSTTVQADETNTSEQLKKLQQMVEQLQQQRAEQDKQMDLLTKELVSVENQLNQSKIVKAEEMVVVTVRQYSPILKMVSALRMVVEIGNLPLMAAYRPITVIFHLMKQRQILLACAAQGLALRSHFIKIMWRGSRVNILVAAPR